MALILLAAKRFETFWTRMGINAMRHENTVIHGLLKAVPRWWFGIKGTPYLIHTFDCAELSATLH